MDPFSVATGTIALLTAVGHATFTVTSFIHTLTIATPAELTAINHELSTLRIALTILLTNPTLTNPSRPPPTTSTLHLQIHSILTNCLAVVRRITAVIPPHDPPALSKCLPELLSLLPSLEAHRASLRLALDLLLLTTPTTALTATATPAPTTAPTQTPAPIPRDDTTTQQQLGRIMEELGRLQGMVEEMHSHPRSRALRDGDGDGGETDGHGEVMLRRYLDGLTSYAETVWSDMDGEEGKLGGEAAVTPRIEEEEEEGGSGSRVVGEERVGGEVRGYERLVGEEVGDAVLGMGALELSPSAREGPEMIVWYGQKKYKEGQHSSDLHIEARRELSEAMYYGRWTQVIDILEMRQNLFGETWANCWQIRTYPGRSLLCRCRPKLTCCSKARRRMARRCGKISRIYTAAPSSVPRGVEGGCPKTH
jgi:hypothetical protein